MTNLFEPFGPWKNISVIQKSGTEIFNCEDNLDNEENMKIQEIKKALPSIEETIVG